MGHLTERAMREIGDTVLQVSDERALFYKVNWIIVHTSHTITDRHGNRGHLVRQRVRKRLWNEAKNRYCILRKFILPKDIAGDSPCRIRPQLPVKQLFCRVWMFFYRISRFFR